MEFIDGRAVAHEITQELTRRINDLKAAGITPTLAILQVGNDPTTTIYVTAKQRAAVPLGIDVHVIRFDTGVQSDALARALTDTVHQLNADPSIHGIILQLPVPETIDDQAIIDEIDPRKDVDGLTATNQAALEAGRELMVPATPQGILRLLAAYRIPLEGATVGLVGHGRLVGRSLAHMLRSRGAILQIADSKTPDLRAVTRGADIVVSAVGQAGLITPDMIDESTVVIDVGLSKVDDQLQGDITEAAKAKARLATPVPGGVGPMTVVSLLANVVLAAELTRLQSSANMTP